MPNCFIPTPTLYQVNNMLNVALHLMGLGMAYAGPTLWEASALWVVALLGARAVTAVRRYRWAGGWVCGWAGGWSHVSSSC